MRNVVLEAMLEFAVPLHIAEVRQLPSRERQRIAEETAWIVACQGDTLMYGSASEFGHGAKQAAKHARHAALVNDDNKDEWIRKCPVCRLGQPEYSAGEIFNFLARGLAVLACQNGGITYAGQHWECRDINCD